MFLVAALPSLFVDYLLLLSLTGIANRNEPSVWLNATSQAPGMGQTISVMWSYPAADTVWVPWVERKLNSSFTVLTGDDTICNLLQVHQDKINGMVMYQPDTDASPFVALTASGLLDALPVQQSQLDRLPCLQALPVITTIPQPPPANATATLDEQLYNWALQTYPNASKAVVVGACRSWVNYSCGWSDPQAAASIDYGVAKRAFIHNLSPHQQPELFAAVIARLNPSGIFTGWAEPEDVMVSQLSKVQSVVLCGTANMAFLAAMPILPTQLPSHRTQPKLNRSSYYLTFQTNEGDTVKNAYSLRAGNWVHPRRGEVSIAWGVSPLVAVYFPALWQYYVETALPTDQFFAAAAGAGYTYPQHWDNPDVYFRRAGMLFRKYMPAAGNWVDVWASGLNLTFYQQYQAGVLSVNGSVEGFSQQPFNNTPINTELANGTPLMLSALGLWYPYAHGCVNTTVAAWYDCVQARIEAVMATVKPPFFILIYGQDFKVDGTAGAMMVDTALEMQGRFAQRAIVVGTQDLAGLTTELHRSMV